MKPPLKSSYVPIRVEDLKWKRIDTIDCSKRMNFISGGIMNTDLTSKGIVADANRQQM